MRILLAILLTFIPSCALANEKEDIIVAKVIAAEACSEGLKGMTAIGNIIANRSIRYNKSPYQIVTKRNQFYGYTSKDRDKIFENKKCSEPALLIAKNLFNISDTTNGAIYFRLDGEPVRRWHRAKTVKIGKHTFYR